MRNRIFIEESDIDNILNKGIPVTANPHWRDRHDVEFIQSNAIMALVEKSKATTPEQLKKEIRHFLNTNIVVKNGS